MTNWTRATAARLAQVSMQLGLSPEEAESAIATGARIQSHRFSELDIQNMIRWKYEHGAEEELKALQGDPIMRLRQWRRERRGE